jgi:hypothetical protein
MTLFSLSMVSLAASERRLRLAAYVRVRRLSAHVRVKRLTAYVRDQVGGALSYAAVPRVGLGPTAPPLCRYAECTADLISQRWWPLQRCSTNQTRASTALARTKNCSSSICHPITVFHLHTDRS